MIMLRLERDQNFDSLPDQRNTNFKMRILILIFTEKLIITNYN